MDQITLLLEKAKNWKCGKLQLQGIHYGIMLDRKWENSFLMARESRLAQRTLSKPQKPCDDIRPQTWCSKASLETL